MKKPRYKVDGHCVIDTTKRHKNDVIGYVVADCLDKDWDMMSGKYTGIHARRMACRIARLLNNGCPCANVSWGK